MTSEPNDMPVIPIGIEDIVQAAKRLEPEPIARRADARTLDERSAASVFLKCENFQRVGAFKFRGAMMRCCCSTPVRKRWEWSPIPRATMPRPWRWRVGCSACRCDHRDAPDGTGGQASGHPWLRCADCPLRADSRVRGNRAVAAESRRHGLTLVHPFNDWNVIAGQGTAALELLDQ